MPKYKTREEWLLAAVEAVRPLFQEKRHELPHDCQVSCGFASTGTRSHHIGQCWSKESSTDENCEHKHGKEFKKIALSLGMVGPMRSAGAGPELKVKLEGIAKALGPYPHGKLKVVHHRAISRSRPRAKCPTCGFQVPMLKRFLAYGAPICPKDKVEMEQIGNWECE